MSRIVVISGHGLIGPGAPDPGAGVQPHTEASWTADLADRVTVQLRKLGHEAGGVEVGTSTQRLQLADAINPDLVLILHGDAGLPAIYSYPGSARGAEGAEALWTALAEVFPWRVSLRKTSPDGYPRAHGLLARGKAPAVLLELVDQRDASDVEWLVARLDLVAEAIARGVPHG